MGKKIFKSITKVMGSKFMDPLGLNKSGLVTPVESMLAGEASPLDGLTGAATIRAAEASQAQQAELAKQQQIIQDNANSLAANSSAENTATVIAGGSASAADTGTDLKRKRVSSLSSTLGV